MIEVNDCDMRMDGRTFTADVNGFISDSNFDFDAGLQVTGDFTGDEKFRYAKMIEKRLNYEPIDWDKMGWVSLNKLQHEKSMRDLYLSCVRFNYLRNKDIWPTT